MALDLQNWIGRTESVEDVLDARPAQLMQSILPTGEPLSVGDRLPPLWCWLYFLKAVPLDEIGRDGHPRKGGFLPPVDLPRRMWAGGRFEFDGDLFIGDRITRHSKILKVLPKEGKTGPLCFVTVEHSYVRAGETVCREEHDIVYREDPVPGAPKPAPVKPKVEFTNREGVDPSILTLFRYSALTFNGHRIHYDREYCRDVEGYHDLVFHGPLTATLLAGFAERESKGRLKTFSYRAVSPLFVDRKFNIYLNRGDGETQAIACDPDCNLAMKAEATFE